MKLFYPINRLGLVLMYHRVADLNYDPLHLNVSPKNFEEHVRIINKYCRPVQMKHMGGDLKRYPKGKIDISVTFDDGYADNFYNAKPILERHETPGTFFIVSGSIDCKEEFFWDGLKSTLLQPETLPPIFEIVINDNKYRWEITASGPCQTADYAHSISGIPSNDIKISRFQLYETIIRLLGPLSNTLRRTILQHLAKWSGQDLPVRKNFLPMTTNDLKDLSNSSLFEVGGHTVNHPQLALIPVEKQEEEIKNCKADLENKINKNIVSFAYPHGSYTDETVKLLEKTGFQNACTIIPHQVMRKTNPYLLPRFSVKDWDGDEFEQNLRNWLTK